MAPLLDAARLIVWRVDVKPMKCTGGGTLLSLVVIAKNEADRIARCIRSVPFADEVLVLDSGSSDGTAQVAEGCGARVLHTDWPGHVLQKNRGLVECAGDWVISLDADEWLSDEAQRELVVALASPGAAQGFSFPRLNHWLGRPLRHGTWYPDRKLRCVRTGVGKWVGDDPHDQLVVEGEVVALTGDIEHDTYRSFSEHVSTVDRYTTIHAASLYARGVRARRRDVLARPPLHFVKAMLLKRAFMDGPAGVVVAGMGTAHVALKWGRLWRLQRG